MADKQLPDINADLDALPFDESVKTQIYNAFYAKDDSQSKQILEQLQIPGKIKNDFYKRRYDTLYGTPQPPAAAQQQPKQEGPGTWEKVKQNAPRSAANLVTGLAMAPAAPLVNAGQSVKGAYEGFKKGGVQGALEGSIKAGIDPYIHAAEHVANSVFHPIDSIEQDPFGTVLDYVALVDPVIRAGSAVRAGATEMAAGSAAKTGLIDNVMNAASKAKEAFVGKPKAAPVASEPPPANKPIEPGTLKTGPVQKLRDSKLTTKVEGTKKIFSEPPKAPPFPEKPSTSVAKKSDTPQPSPGSQGARFKSDPNGNIYDEASGNPVDAEIVEPSIPQTQPPPQLGQAGPQPRFYASESGEVLDASQPPPSTYQPGGAPQLPAAQQNAALPQSNVKGYLPEATPDPAYVDINSMATEYKVSPDTLHKFNQLDINTLEHVAHQADQMVQQFVSGEVANPELLAKASESSRAAKALLKQKSQYMEGTRPTNQYPTDQAIKAEAGLAPQDAPQSGSTPPATEPPPKFAPKSDIPVTDLYKSMSKANKGVSPDPDATWNTRDMARDERNNLSVSQEMQSSKGTKPAKPKTSTPKAQAKAPTVETPADPVQAEVAKPPAKTAAAPPAAPAPVVAQEPVTPAVTVTESAPVVEPVKSEIQTTLEPAVEATAPVAETPAPVINAPAPQAEPVKATAASQATPSRGQKLKDKLDQKKAIEAPKPEKKASSDHGFKEAPLGKDGKASYRDSGGIGSVKVRKGERMFTRLDKDGVAENVTVYEQNGKVNVLDTEDKVLGSFPAGTSAEDAISQQFGKAKSADKVESPSRPDSAASVKPTDEIPKKKVGKPETEFMTYQRQLYEKNGRGYKPTKQEYEEAKRLANDEELEKYFSEKKPVAPPAFKLPKEKGEGKIKLKSVTMKDKSSNGDRIFSLEYSDRGLPKVENYAMVKQPDGKYHLMEAKSRKRIASYEADSVEDAIKQALP